MFTKEKIQTHFPNGLKGIIFDCDGVILDSRQANITYYNLVRESLDLPKLTKEQEDYVQMCSGMEAFEYIVPKALHSMLRDRSNQLIYEASVRPNLNLYDDVAQTLLALKEKGYKIAMHTNRSKDIFKILDEFELNGFFDPIMHCEIVKTKPDPEGVYKILDDWKCQANDVLFVGDSEADLLASSKAGVAMVSFQNPKLDAKLGLVNSYKQLMEAIL